MSSINFLNIFFSKKYTYKNIFFVLFLLILLLFACYKFSHITYYFSDNIFLNYIHNLSKSRGFFEILIEKNNIFGLPIIPHNPYLNLLSYLNYDVPGFEGYFVYQLVFKFLEILVFSIAIWSLNQKIYFWHYLVFFSFIFHFSIFDHQSYINFPILIFNIFVLISIKFQKKNYLPFTLIFLGSFWSFFTNPMYFFITSFGPMSFLIINSILNKNYKFFLNSILAFLPFVIMYILLVMGTARFALGDLVISETSNIYNFTIINSKLLQLTLIFLILQKFFFEKKNFLKDNNFLILVIFSILSLIFGIIFKYQIFNWNIPHPIYIDYSLQYIYLAVISIYLCENNIKNNFAKLFILLIFFIKLPAYFPKDYKADNSIFPFMNRFFWEKNEKLNIDSILENKSIYLNLPNRSSELVKYLDNNELIMRNYIIDFKSSLNWSDFYEASYHTTYGHSLLLGINTFLATNLEKRTLYKNTVPRYNLGYKYLDILNLDIILSDIEIKNYKLIKKLKFKKFSLFLYNVDKNIDKKRCKLEADRTKSNKIIFLVKTSETIKKCKAIFPIPYSHTNKFTVNNSIVETNNFEKYWHSIDLKNRDIVTVSKKSFFSYLLSSYRDYKDFKLNY